MREYKFRGKRKDGKDKDDNFVKGDYLYDNVTGKHFIIVDFCETIYAEAHDSCIAIEIKEETRGQYTGLKDKNGVEIYDGDNVLGDNYYKGEVKFGNNTDMSRHYFNIGFYIEWDILTNPHNVVRQDIGYWALDRKEIIEVIGNIHDETTVNK